MKQLATQLAKEFGKIDKANAKAFDANAKKYIATLTPMTDLVAKLKAERKQSLVDVSEPVLIMRWIVWATRSTTNTSPRQRKMAPIRAQLILKP